MRPSLRLSHWHLSPRPRLRPSKVSLEISNTDRNIILKNWRLCSARYFFSFKTHIVLNSLNKEETETEEMHCGKIYHPSLGWYRMHVGRPDSLALDWGTKKKWFLSYDGKWLQWQVHPLCQMKEICFNMFEGNCYMKHINGRLISHVQQAHF